MYWKEFQIDCYCSPGASRERGLAGDCGSLSQALVSEMRSGLVEGGERSGTDISVNN